MVKFKFVFLYWWEVEVFFWLNYWNSLFCWLGVKLMFVFVIENCSLVCLFLVFNNWFWMVILFWLVNLIVLLFRLIKIWLRWRRLLIKIGGILGLRWKLRVKFLVFVWMFKILWRLFIIFFMEKGFCLSFNLFVFILEKFKILLIIFNNNFFVYWIFWR